MMSSNYYRNQNRFKGKIFNFLKTNKVLILICLTLFVFFFFIGVFTVCKHRSDLEIDNMFNKFFLNFINGDINWLSLFFSYSIITIFVFLILSIFSFSSFFIVFDFMLISLFSYFVGFDITIYIISFNFWGFLNFLLLMMLPLVLIFFLSMIFICVKFKKGRDLKKYGRGCLYQGYLKLFIFLVMVILLVEFLFCLLLLFTKITIIS